MMKTLTSRLLFVGEDGEFLHQIRKALPKGLSADAVDSPESALQQLRFNDVDIAIINLDTLKPVDFGLLDWLHENHSLTVCILITGLSPTVAIAATEQVSAFDYWIKPIAPAEVTYRIKRALAHRRLLVAEQEANLRLERLNKQVGDRIRHATGELLNSNERLSAANRAKDQFLAAMSHELRTPLTAITGAVRILQSPKTTEAKAHTILEILDRNVGILKRLLDDLLDCSRIASGKLSLDLGPTNLVDSVNAAVETMRTKAAEARIDLRVHLPADRVVVNGNPLRLQQIAWNLIDNAIKFTPPGGNVLVTLVGRSDDVELIVCDSGAGVSSADKERIFEPFAQADGSDALRKGGLGLGLALVRNLTQIHKGSVRVESDGPGHGARFVVTLPLNRKACPVNQAA